MISKTLLIFKYYLKTAINFAKEFYGSFILFIFIALFVGPWPLNLILNQFETIKYGHWILIFLYATALVMGLKQIFRLMVADSFYLMNYLKEKYVIRIKCSHLFFCGIVLTVPLVALYAIKFGATSLTVVALVFCVFVSLCCSLLFRFSDANAMGGDNGDIKVSFFLKQNRSRLRFRSVLSLIMSYCYRRANRMQIIYYLLLSIVFTWYVSIVLRNNQLTIVWPYVIPVACLLLVYLESNVVVLRDLVHYDQVLGWSTYLASASFSLLSFSLLYIVHCIFLWSVLSVNISALLILFPFFLLLICYIELVKISSLDSQFLRVVLVCASVFIPIAIPIFTYKAIKGICR